MRFPIAISLSPNTERNDVWLAIKTLFSPWLWKHGESTNLVVDWFKSRYPNYDSYTYNSGRSALYEVLKALKIADEDEVLIQAFTCVAVPNAIIWNGAVPKYVDIEPGTFNINPEELEKNITKKTKAVIVQHTFGIPADIIAIQKISKKHGLLLIEDCAHSLGARVGNARLGSFGDASIFSFGRDKVLSSVFGGVGMIKSTDKNACAKLQTSHETLPMPSYFWILQQLLHPILCNLFVLPFYTVFSIGKIFLVLFQKLRLLSLPVDRCEGNTNMPSIYPSLYPNALARLAVLQLSKLERFNKKRNELSHVYGRSIVGSINLRYPIHLENKEQVLNKAKHEGVLIGNWYSNIIDPGYTNYEAALYTIGACPVAEHAAKTVINLPTYPRMSIEDAQRIQKLIHSYDHL